MAFGLQISGDDPAILMTETPEDIYMNTRTRSLNRSLRVALLVAVSCVASVAAAGDTTGEKSVAVRYDDLNLSSQQGVEHLYSRIRAAARKVCGSAGEVAPLRLRQQRAQCENTAVAAAVKQVNNGILTAMHRGKSTRRLG